MRDADVFEPELPSTLQAELRPYQHDGFRWLARLARWGAGRVPGRRHGPRQDRADPRAAARPRPARAGAGGGADLGGRQLARRGRAASPPPSTSSPTPGPHPRACGGSRASDPSTWSSPPTDCSRTMPARSAPSTGTAPCSTRRRPSRTRRPGRARAARELKARFRLVTTGTPIQNNLMDLYSLFGFINPGMLGSTEHYRRHFAAPIERDADPAARARLRRLIAPFVLRRLKTEVARRSAAAHRDHAARGDVAGRGGVVRGVAPARGG